MTARDDAVSLADLLGLAVDLLVVDVGANPIDGDPPYRPLVVSGIARVVGFEPNPQALRELEQRKGPRETYLPHALGDGGRRPLYVCRAPGMTSLLRPNPAVLACFHGFTEWGTVERVEEVATVRLDDVPGVEEADLLKIDIQGAELMVFEHAPRTLAACVAVHTEVEFLPLYEGQPLFGDVDRHLRSAGFVLHKFDPLVSRCVRPLTVNGDPYAGLGQLVWADAVYIRDFTRLDALSDRKLLRMAVVMHDVYGALDIALHVLREHDRRAGSQLAAEYAALLARR